MQAIKLKFGNERRMSMTENEIKKATIEDAIYCAKAMACLEVCEDCRFYGLCHTWCDDVYGIMIEALEEVKAYRAIGTVEDLKTMKENGAFTGVELAQILAMQMELKKYQSIGTIEEFKAIKSDGGFTDDLLNMGYTKGIKDGYAKAIDEFVSRLEKHEQENWIDHHEYGITWSDIEMIAEQLKGGANNG